MYFRYDSDTSACDKRASSSRKNAAVLITSVVVPVLVVAALFVACFIWRAKRKSNGVHPVALVPTCIFSVYLVSLLFISYLCNQFL